MGCDLSTIGVIFMQPKIWFTADDHFSHNLMKVQRGFNYLKEHDQKLIYNWNEEAGVGKSDWVFIIGDFSFGAPGYTIGVLKQLLGRKFLIHGNHDKLNAELKSYFDWDKDVYDLKIKDNDDRFPWMKNKVRIFLSHYAHRVWPASHHGTFHLYGHSHGNLTDDPMSLSFDVGVDCHNLCPISYDQVKDIMAQKQCLDRYKNRKKGSR